MTDIMVHASHCCVRHGCKYGDADCPVVAGTVPQQYPCEFCAMDEEEHAGQLFQVTVMEDGKTVKIWTKQGLFGNELARLLRLVADDFDSGDVRRVR